MDYTEHSKIGRREALAMFGAALAFGCAADTPTSPASPTSTTTTPPGADSAASCAVAPTETIGPYPSLTDLIRSDIREGKSGTPVTLTITVVNVNNSCSAVANANVEIWQCDAAGNYSEYSQPGFNGAGQTFLRGVQTTDANGQVTFTTIYPGWYQGRATHIHVEVYRSGTIIKTTQIAFPESISAAVYVSGVYASKGQSPTSNASDNVFSDGVINELATVTGNTMNGYTATLNIGIAV
jgi:protocatechuate 3,4-dioxygenase beta subunit